MRALGVVGQDLGEALARERLGDLVPAVLGLQHGAQHDEPSICAHTHWQVRMGRGAGAGGGCRGAAQGSGAPETKRAFPLPPFLFLALPTKVSLAGEGKQSGRTSPLRGNFEPIMSSMVSKNSMGMLGRCASKMVTALLYSNSVS
jgi:hypothetical protein